MSRYTLPAKETLREIAARQEQKEREIEGASEDHLSGLQDRDAAAQLIQVSVGGNVCINHSANLFQRNYRGYRARRELKGHDLSGSTRWLEVCTYTMLVAHITHEFRLSGMVRRNVDF